VFPWQLVPQRKERGKSVQNSPSTPPGHSDIVAKCQTAFSKCYQMVTKQLQGLKHPGRGASRSVFFVRGCCVVLYEDSCILHIYEGPLGRTGNIAPSSSDAIPMGSKRFTLHGIEYAFLWLSSYFDVY
jgi:hypothetical protein